MMLKFAWPWSERKQRQVSETLLLLNQIKGQKLIGVTVDSQGKEWQLHFADFVVFVSDPFPSPIIKRESS